jgi:hypothetical protein
MKTVVQREPFMCVRCFAMLRVLTDTQSQLRGPEDASVTFCAECGAAYITNVPVEIVRTGAPAGWRLLPDNEMTPEMRRISQGMAELARLRRN